MVKINELIIFRPFGWLAEVYTSVWDLTHRQVMNYGCKVDLIERTNLDSQGKKPHNLKMSGWQAPIYANSIYIRSISEDFACPNT